MSTILSEKQRLWMARGISSVLFLLYGFSLLVIWVSAGGLHLEDAYLKYGFAMILISSIEGIFYLSTNKIYGSLGVENCKSKMERNIDTITKKIKEKFYFQNREKGEKHFKQLIIATCLLFVVCSILLFLSAWTFLGLVNAIISI